MSSYDGPERRNMDKLINDLDKRFMKVEHALVALTERVEGIHKRNKDREETSHEKDVEILLQLRKLRDTIYGNGAEGMTVRISRVEDETKRVSSIVPSLQRAVWIGGGVIAAASFLSPFISRYVLG